MHQNKSPSHLLQKPKKTEKGGSHSNELEKSHWQTKANTTTIHEIRM